MKKSKLVAVLLVVVMVFSVSPAFAERSTGEAVGDAAAVGLAGAGYGAVIGGILGGIAGFCIGGPAGAWAGAEAGAWAGGGIGGGGGVIAGAAGAVTAKDVSDFMERMRPTEEEMRRWEQARNDYETAEALVKMGELGYRMYGDYKNGLFKQNFENGTYDRELWYTTNPEWTEYPGDWFK